MFLFFCPLLNILIRFFFLFLPGFADVFFQEKEENQTKKKLFDNSGPSSVDTILQMGWCPCAAHEAGEGR